MDVVFVVIVGFENDKVAYENILWIQVAPAGITGEGLWVPAQPRRGHLASKPLNISSLLLVLCKPWPISLGLA